MTCANLRLIHCESTWAAKTAQHQETVQWHPQPTRLPYTGRLLEMAHVRILQCLVYILMSFDASSAWRYRPWVGSGDARKIEIPCWRTKRTLRTWEPAINFIKYFYWRSQEQAGFDLWFDPKVSQAENEKSCGPGIEVELLGWNQRGRSRNIYACATEPDPWSKRTCKWISTRPPTVSR